MIPQQTNQLDKRFQAIRVILWILAFSILFIITAGVNL